MVLKIELQKCAKHSKKGPKTQNPETGNFRSNGRPKKNHENGGQKPTQKRWDNRRRDQPQNDRKTNRKTTAHGSPEHFVIEHQPALR
jgi:hypothetical protein